MVRVFRMIFFGGGGGIKRHCEGQGLVVFVIDGFV